MGCADPGQWHQCRLGPEYQPPMCFRRARKPLIERYSLGVFRFAKMTLGGSPNDGGWGHFSDPRKPIVSM
jgi:hypothetical protein